MLDAHTTVAQNTPQIVTSSMIIFGLPLNDLVLLATLAWIAIQAGFFLYGKFKKKD